MCHEEIRARIDQLRTELETRLVELDHLLELLEQNGDDEGSGGSARRRTGLTLIRGSIAAMVAVTGTVGALLNRRPAHPVLTAGIIVAAASAAAVVLVPASSPRRQIAETALPPGAAFSLPAPGAGSAPARTAPAPAAPTGSRAPSRTVTLVSAATSPRRTPTSPSTGPSPLPSASAPSPAIPTPSGTGTGSSLPTSPPTPQSCLVTLGVLGIVDACLL